SHVFSSDLSSYILIRSRADDALRVGARVFWWRSRADTLLRVCTPLARVRTVLSVCALEYFSGARVPAISSACALPSLACGRCSLRVHARILLTYFHECYKCSTSVNESCVCKGRSFTFSFLSR